MELGIYDIIKKIVITPKSVELRKKLGKITFEVNSYSNKILVKNAVEKIWNVKVRDVRMITVPGKTKKVARRSFIMPSRKKAIITLRPGYAIDLPDNMETMGAPAMAQKSTHEAGE